MKTVIEMAREAGIDPVIDPIEGVFFDCYQEELERFAELVRADEREKYKWDVHSCGPTCTKVACVAVREAVEAEREKIIAKNAPEIERMNAYIKELEHQAARYQVLRTWDLSGYDYGLYSPEEVDKAVDACIESNT